MDTTEADPGLEAGAGSESVRDAVVAAFKEHGAPVETDYHLPGNDGSSAEIGDGTPAGDRERDENGRVKKADAAPAHGDAAASPDAGKQNSGTDEPNGKADQGSNSDGPPPGWPADAKAEWSKLPPAIQAAVVKRERENNEGGRLWSEEKRHYEELVSPLREAAQRRGIEEREGIRRLIAAQDALDRNPVGAIQWLAQSYGVDLTKLANAAQAAPRVDPALQTLHHELSQLKQTLSAREDAEIQSEISSFAKDKPYFGEVRQTMARLLEAGEADSLEDAYDKAVWALPAVREKLLADREAQRDAERRHKATTQVTKARSAAVSTTGSPVGSPTSKSQAYDTVRDAVLAAWQTHASA